MNNVAFIKRAALVILALLLPITVTCKKQTLVITEEGEFKREIDITGWDPGEDFVYLSYWDGGFHYPWQGEDSLDYRIEDDLLWVNGKLVGANLTLVAFTDLSNPEEIVTVYTYAGQLPELKRFPNLVAVDAEEIVDADLKHLEGLTKLRLLELDVTDITDAGLAHLKGLKNLRELGLIGTQITDAGLAHLKGLKNLKGLYLLETDITDAGLRHLKGLTNLRWLNLFGTNITDAGLTHLEGLTNLRVLNLSRTEITDAGLAHLKGLKNLRELYLEGTYITGAGVKGLQKALPECKIRY